MIRRTIYRATRQLLPQDAATHRPIDVATAPFHSLADARRYVDAWAREPQPPEEAPRIRGGIVERLDFTAEWSFAADAPEWCRA